MMRILNLKTNRLKNPLGFAINNKPRLSWIVESESARRQEAAQIEVSTDMEFSNIIFDSGKRTDIDSISYPLDIELKPRTRYYWRVRVWGDDRTEAVSEPAWFETSKMDEPWQAKWITPDFDPSFHPVIFSDFNVEKKVVNARAYVCGLGLYEMTINGEKTGEECLSPGLVAYDKWIPYQTYDITGQLKKGTNSIEVLLGNGWYKGRYGLNRRVLFQYGDKFALICEIHITYDDGSTEIFAPTQTGSRENQKLKTAVFLTAKFMMTLL